MCVHEGDDERDSLSNQLKAEPTRLSLAILATYQKKKLPPLVNRDPLHTRGVYIHTVSIKNGLFRLLRLSSNRLFSRLTSTVIHSSPSETQGGSNEQRYVSGLIIGARYVKRYRLKSHYLVLCFRHVQCSVL